MTETDSGTIRTSLLFIRSLTGLIVVVLRLNIWLIINPVSFKLVVGNLQIFKILEFFECQ